MSSPVRCPVVAECVARKLRIGQQNVSDSEPFQGAASVPTSSPEGSITSEESCHCRRQSPQARNGANNVTYNETYNRGNNGAYNGTNNGAYNGTNNGAYNGTNNGAYNGTNNGTMEFGDAFWDSLINFMTESCKVMQQYKLSSPDQMSKDEKQRKMKQLLKRIEEKEREIRQLNEEFQQLVPPKEAKKKCPAKQVCPRLRGEECPDPNCGSYEEEEYESYAAYAPQPYNINQTYQQYPTQNQMGPPMPRYDETMQGMYSNPQQQVFDDTYTDCDGMCQNICSPTCQKPCSQSYQQWGQSGFY